MGQGGRGGGGGGGENSDRRGMGHRRGKGRRWEFYSEAGEIGETKC